MSGRVISADQDAFKRSYEMKVKELYRRVPAHFMPMIIECSLVNCSTRMS